MNSNVDWHLQNQNREYLDLAIRRLSLPVLIWVDQFTDLINKNLESANKKDIRINDIGCHVGHFFRNIDQIKSNVSYTGFDISDTYLEIARSHFPSGNFVNEDVVSENFNSAKYECDISVISATLEHIDDYELFLKNIFESTKLFVVLRTFIGEESLEDYCLKPGARQSYLIRQFIFEDIKDRPFNLGWQCEVIQDKATESKAKEVCESIFRTQKIIIFKNRN